MSRAAWLEKRRSGIGASQAAAVLGLVPGAFDVWASITQGVHMQDNPALRRGRFLEAGIIRWYAEVYDRHVLPSVWARHPEVPCVVGTPDGFLADSPGSQKREAVLEIKDVGPHMRHAWGEPGTDQVPARVVIQVCQSMAIMDLDRCHVVPLFEGEGGDPVEYIVHRDRDLEAHMLKQLGAWWTHHIIMGVEPDRSTARHLDEYIAARFPRETEPLRPATDAEIPLLEELRYGTRVKKAVDEKVKGLKSALKLSIGDAEGITWDGQKVTYRLGKEVHVKAHTRKASRVLRVPQRWGRALPAPEEQTGKELPGARLQDVRP